jgi:hypothetical protein
MGWGGRRLAHGQRAYRRDGEDGRRADPEDRPSDPGH